MPIIPTVWEGEAGDFKFEASLSSIARSCLKIKQKGLGICSVLVRVLA